MKHQKQRRDQFSQGPLADSLPSAAMAGHAGGSVLQRNGSQNFGGPQEQGGAVAIDMGGMDNPSYSSQMQLLEEQVKYEIYTIVFAKCYLSKECSCINHFN